MGETQISPLNKPGSSHILVIPKIVNFIVPGTHAHAHAHAHAFAAQRRLVVVHPPQPPGPQFWGRCWTVPPKVGGRGAEVND